MRASGEYYSRKGIIGYITKYQCERTLIAKSQITALQLAFLDVTPSQRAEDRETVQCEKYSLWFIVLGFVVYVSHY